MQMHRLFKFGSGGQLPSGNPLWEVPLALGQHMGGKNPYDWFRGRPLLDEDLSTARDGRGVVAMGKYTWNSFGGGIITRFDVNDYGQDPNKTKLEKFLKQPVISNAIGRWVKVSNRGRADFLRNKVIEPLRQEQARSRLNAKKAINQQVGEGGVDPKLLQKVQADPRAAGYVARNLQGRTERKLMMPEEQLIDAAPSKEERTALQRFMDEKFGR